MSTLKFKPVTMRDGAKLRRYYRDCNYGLCEYSAGTKLMWNRTLHPAWAVTSCGTPGDTPWVLVGLWHQNARGLMRVLGAPGVSRRVPTVPRD